MQKIPTIYQRDPATNLKHVMNEPHPDCGWVFDGEGEPTYKWDGTAVQLRSDGHTVKMWKRREVKADTEPPAHWRPAAVPDVPDPNTGKRVGWVPCDRNDPADRWHFKALDDVGSWEPGTYELVGPKVQGNPHDFDEHMLIPHGGIVGEVPTEFSHLAAYLHDVAGGMLIEDEDGAPYPFGFEGIVWHHPDGRMAKIKVRDFPDPNDA